MKSYLSVLTVCLAMLSIATCCYDDCIRKFTTEIGNADHQGNSSQINSDFCRAMANQVSCLNGVMSSCPPHQRTLIQSMLTIFIQPDYQRTCLGTGAGSNGLTSTAPGTQTNGTSMIGRTFPSNSMFPSNPMMSPKYPMIHPTSMSLPGSPHINYNNMLPNTQAVMLCSQKIKTCQTTFNRTFSSDVAIYNVSGICQSLKQYTVCLMNLVSSDCGSLVSQSRNLVYRMQQQYGGMCSSDAQASTMGMLECMNKTMECYSDFNKTFVPALAESNLVKMCQSLDSYTSCSQKVRTAQQCENIALKSLSSIASTKQRHNVYCGDDNGHTAHQCMQRFQDCFGPFNRTFFPALHRANLTEVCRSLTSYTLCIGRLTPTCSQQLWQMLQSAQALKLQFSESCHPKILQISQCKHLAQCSNSFLQRFPSAATSSSGLCGNIGNYFPCVARSLEECRLPQTTTGISFHNLGNLMHSYCQKLSADSKLLQCPSFVACQAAILVSFSPNLSNVFEGSTWCTFMQVSIGCAEHALQSSSCSLANDVDLRRNINEMDSLRVHTCEAEFSLTEERKRQTDEEENLMDSAHGKSSSDDNNTDDNGGNAVRHGSTYGFYYLALLSMTIYFFEN